MWLKPNLIKYFFLEKDGARSNTKTSLLQLQKEFEIFFKELRHHFSEYYSFPPNHSRKMKYSFVSIFIKKDEQVSLDELKKPTYLYKVVLKKYIYNYSHNTITISERKI
jgi:hypothetical protein